MNSKDKLVVLLSRFPYPLEKGDKLRAFHQIAELSKFFEIYLKPVISFPIEEKTKLIYYFNQ
jgi:hypothetical protein